jgi:hypothetical protein
MYVSSPRCPAVVARKCGVLHLGVPFHSFTGLAPRGEKGLHQEDGGDAGTGEPEPARSKGPLTRAPRKFNTRTGTEDGTPGGSCVSE